MSFGFLGIQFGWALQMANMSAIYEYLGADAHQIPILWLAAPLTGLLVQPVIGHLSDRTWNRLGRRRPYFLTGALLASFALIAMPSSGTLWMAAGLLWVMDASINISMEPFRALIADLLPPEQRTRGYAMQALFIGLGAVIASMLPWLLYDLFPAGSDGGTPGKTIPFGVRLAFYLGAFTFLAAVLWTIFTTREHPPEDLEAFRRMKAEKAGFGAAVVEIFHDVLAMPPTMRRLAWVQIFTWLGFFCMWLYFGVAVARNIFGGTPGTPAYEQGIAWAGNCFAMYSAVCFAFSFALPAVAGRLGRRLTHGLCLLMGAIGLLSVAVIDDKYLLLLSMVGVGVAWASTLSMPYAILAGALPAGEDRHLHGHLQLLHRHPGDPGRARLRHDHGAPPHQRERAGAATGRRQPVRRRRHRRPLAGGGGGALHHRHRARGRSHAPARPPSYRRGEGRVRGGRVRGGKLRSGVSIPRH